MQCCPRAVILGAIVLLLAGCGGGASVSSSDADALASAPDVSSPTDALTVDLGGSDAVVADSSSDGSNLSCLPAPPVVPTTNFFTEIGAAAGIQTNGFITALTKSVPINDHSRLGVVDLDGDGYDDIVMHSLFPNPQQGIPFEHLVFRNNGDGTFTDVSDQSGLRTIQAAFFAFADIDNDGDQDCFAGLDIPLNGKTSLILLNDGTGKFTVKANSGVEQLTIPAANAVFADFNNDGKLDLFIGAGGTSSGSKDALLFGNGDGTFVDVSAKLVADPGQPSNGSVTCDIDNDGDLDIIVSTYGVSVKRGANILWLNDGAGNFTNVAVEKGFDSLALGNSWLSGTDTEPNKGPGEFIGSNGFGVDCGDVNGDGQMDILLAAISHPVASDYTRHWSDPSQLLINQGPTKAFVFENQWSERKLPFNEGDVDAALVDFDNDGRLDISLSRDKKYEGSYSDVEQKAWFGLFRQLDTGAFQSLGPVSGINRLDATLTASLATCTGDGECTVAGETCLRGACRHACTTDSDCPSADEMCGVWWKTDNSGSERFCKLKLLMKNAQNHVWADFDNDGDMDLLVGGRDTGGGRPNYLFRNEIGHKNRWITLRLQGNGTTVNRDAIGARVTITANGRSITREVRSSRGMYNSMDTRALHFGLGDISCQWTLTVRWPDGTTQALDASQFQEQRIWRLIYPKTVAPLK